MVEVEQSETLTETGEVVENQEQRINVPFQEVEVVVVQTVEELLLQLEILYVEILTVVL